MTLGGLRAQLFCAATADRQQSFSGSSAGRAARLPGIRFLRLRWFFLRLLPALRSNGTRQPGGRHQQHTKRNHQPDHEPTHRYDSPQEYQTGALGSATPPGPPPRQRSAKKEKTMRRAVILPASNRFFSFFLPHCRPPAGSGAEERDRPPFFCRGGRGFAKKTGILRPIDSTGSRESLPLCYGQEGSFSATTMTPP